MAKSARSSKYKKLFIITAIFSILCNIGPILAYTIKALINADLTYEKIAISLTVFIVIIMTIVAMLNKLVLRSRIWIILLAIYICIDNILTPLIIIAVCQVLDELIITPLKNSFKQKYIINKEIDARL